MTIEIKDSITLADNNKYEVCSKTTYQDNNYLFLLDINDYKNLKIGMEKIQGEQISIIEIENEELIRTLMPLFFNEVKDFLKEAEEQ